MKKLLIALALVFSLGFGSIAHAEEASNIPDNYWTVQIFSPVVSESKQTLNVEYKVLSVYEADNQYDVKLLQNGTQIATDTITHAYGDSGAFSITLPSSGTYSYQVSATNTAESPNHGQTKSSEAVNIKVIDGTVTNTVPAPAGTTSTNNGSGATSGSGAGQTNGTTGNGSVSDKAATTNKAGSSLGANTTKAKTSDKKWYFIGAAILILGGAAYYWFVYRAAGELE